MARQQISRRGALKAAFAATAGLAAPALVNGARAQSKNELVFVGFGGAYQEGQAKALFEPFEKETGIKIVQTTGVEIAIVGRQRLQWKRPKMVGAVLAAWMNQHGNTLIRTQRIIARGAAKGFRPAGCLQAWQADPDGGCAASKCTRMRTTSALTSLRVVSSPRLQFAAALAKASSAPAIAFSTSSRPSIL